MTSIRSSFLALLLSGPLLAISCGGGTPIKIGGGPVPVPAGIYVTQDNTFGALQPSLVLEFSKTASGQVNPSPTITGPANLVFTPAALDSNGDLYVGGAVYTGNNPASSAVEILEYPPDAGGTSTPIRTIQGTATGLNVLGDSSIGGLTFDTAGNIYVAANVLVGQDVYSGISVFSPAAIGNAAPTVVIAGSATTLSFANQIAVDTGGNIYAAGAGNGASPSAVLIFSSGSAGNVAPSRSITGPNTMLDDVLGIALDSMGNLYVSNGTFNGATPSIVVFSAGSTGNATPTRVIAGAATGLASPGNLAVDSTGTVYILNGTNILVFAPTATGNVAPTATITAPGFVEVAGIAVSP
jgi:hypothetical protein